MYNTVHKDRLRVFEPIDAAAKSHQEALKRAQVLFFLLSPPPSVKISCTLADVANFFMCWTRPWHGENLCLGAEPNTVTVGSSVSLTATRERPHPLGRAAAAQCSWSAGVLQHTVCHQLLIINPRNNNLQPQRSVVGRLQRRVLLRRMVLYYGMAPEIRAGLAQWSSVSWTHWQRTT